MRNYFTIREFARLRQVDINSLRYYEKLGILRPAYVDPDSRYRYYTAEQLSQLDMILLCIHLGIPLKRMRDYVDADGTFQNRALMEEGCRVMQERVRELENSLRGIEHTLDYLENMEKYAQVQGSYVRFIKSRRVMAAAFDASLDDVCAVETAFSTLHTEAQEKKLYPIMPMGILLRYSEEGLKRFVCWEITDMSSEDSKIVTLPGAEYQCVQVDWEMTCDIQKLVEARLDISGQATVYVSNMGRSRFRFGTRVGELQLLLTQEK